MQVTNAISTSRLTRRYANGVGVQDLSLSVGRGEIYGFLGLNGAGKTTTIRMLLGMVRPSAGSARIFGVRSDGGSGNLWSRVGYLVETPHPYSELTVRENLEIFRRLRRIADRHAVDRILERLGLVPYADRRSGTLSLGNGQRLGLAKALLHDPDLLILDEPSNGLDPAGVVEIRELLHELARERGTTVFMSSHILSEVARLATRIGVIHRGRLIAELDAEELQHQRRRRLAVDARDQRAAHAALSTAGFTVRVGDGGILELTDERAVACPDHISRLLVGAGVPPIRLGVEQEDLESYFLRLVGTEGGGGL